MFDKDRYSRRKWQKAVALVLLIVLAPACVVNPAQIYIPLAYAFVGLCVALLISPTPAAAVVGLVGGGLIGAAFYNNSLKKQLVEPRRSASAPEK
jgi:hypothetical protein